MIALHNLSGIDDAMYVKIGAYINAGYVFLRVEFENGRPVLMYRWNRRDRWTPTASYTNRSTDTRREQFLHNGRRAIERRIVEVQT